MLNRKTEIQLCSGFHFEVIHLDGGEGASRTSSAVEISGDHFHCPFIFGQKIFAHHLIRDLLITGRIHFVFRRKIHPKLYHLKCATLFAETFLVIFFMQEPRGSGHPLHIAFTDHAVITS